MIGIKIEELINIYIKERQKLLDKIIKLVEDDKPGRIGVYKELIEDIDKQINILVKYAEGNDYIEKGTQNPPAYTPESG